jgi:hypothetical protein
MESTELQSACGDEVRGVIFEGAPVPQPYRRKPGDCLGRTYHLGADSTLADRSPF